MEVPIPTPPDRTFRNQKMVLTWLFPPGRMGLANLTFIDCHLIGPAVLVAETPVTFEGAFSEGTFESSAWKLPSGAPIRGCIPIRNCHFIRCQFEGIAFGAPEHKMDGLARAVGWMFEGSPHLRPPTSSSGP
jgi:hypothetical protein